MTKAAIFSINFLLNFVRNRSDYNLLLSTFQVVGPLTFMDPCPFSYLAMNLGC